MEFLEGHPPREQRLRYYVDVYSTAQKWKLLFQVRSMIDPKFYLTFYFIRIELLPVPSAVPFEILLAEEILPDPEGIAAVPVTVPAG